MLPGGARIMCISRHDVHRFDMYYADPAQPLTAAGEGLGGLDDLDDLSKV